MKLFVSDLHLDPTNPQSLKPFRDCLERYRDGLAELYILGDLFEFWIGDDYVPATAKETAVLLKGLSERGVGVFFMAGNRDFLLGEEFASHCGMTILDDPTVITINGKPTLLSHGDHLCTDDHVYQAIRAKVRDPQWQQAVLAQTVEQRLAMANEARDESQRHTGEAAEEIMDVNPDAVMSCMTKAGVQQMIHGHTHRPGDHALVVNDAPARRIVLGDWYKPEHVHIALDDRLLPFPG
ncbi:MAG: UDP-2,3-diacylglucosamine diphosphatase [Pseudomonadota bacterium]